MSAGYWSVQRRRRWPYVAVAVVAAVIGVGVGFVLDQGGGTAGGGGSAAAGAGPCPAPRSQDGAIKAAVCFDTMLYRLEGQPEDQAASQLQTAVANPASADRLATLVSQGVPQGGRAAPGVLTVNVGNYDDQTSQVFLWVATARAARPDAGNSNPASATAGSWTTDSVVVSWSGDRWALTDVSRQDTAPPAGNRNLQPTWAGAPYASR
jgi:hypothetical protein